jgi:hypothetical protein
MIEKSSAASFTLATIAILGQPPSVIGAQHDQSKGWFGFTAGSFLDRIAKIICKE